MSRMSYPPVGGEGVSTVGVVGGRVGTTVPAVPVVVPHVTRGVTPKKGVNFIMRIYTK